MNIAPFVCFVWVIWHESGAVEIIKGVDDVHNDRMEGKFHVVLFLVSWNRQKLDINRKCF